MFFSNINYYLRKSAYVFIEIPVFLNQLASLLYGRADVPVFIQGTQVSVVICRSNRHPISMGYAGLERDLATFPG